MNDLRRLSRAGSLALLAVGLILASASAANAQPQSEHVVWDPPRIEQTLGFAGSARVVATIISDARLEDVTLSVVPELEPYVDVQPATFDVMERNTAYEVAITLSVPHGTYPGQYSGTIHIRDGKRTRPETLKVVLNVFYEGVVIPDTTRVLHDSTTRFLVAVAPDQSSLTFSEMTDELRGLTPGDILVVGVTPLTPWGLLGEVWNVLSVGDQVVVEVGPATVEDAITEGEIVLSETLTPDNLLSATALRAGASLHPADEARLQAASPGFYVDIDDIVLYDADGDEDTTDDQITASGSVSIDPRFDFTLSLEGGQIETLAFTNTTTETVSIEVSTSVDLWSIEEEVEVMRYTLQPIVAWVGWVPVVLVPVLTVNIGVDGSVSVGISAGVEQQAQITAGLEYSGGDWHTIRDFSNHFEISPPTVTAGCSVKGYAGPRLNLLLYGLVGPYADIEGYLDLEADIFSDPWWELYGGIEVGVGVRFEVLGEEIADYEVPALIGYRVLLLSAPSAAGEIAGSVRDAVTRQPLDGVVATVQDGAATVASGATDGNGQYAISVPAGTGYRVTFTKTGYLAAVYNDVSVPEDITTYLEVVLQIDSDYAGNGQVEGRILNALSGQGVSGLSIALREGINTTVGAVVATTVSGASGFYQFTDLPAGQYTAQASGAGYNTANFTIICIGGTTTSGQDGTISPVLSVGETRIVLTWGAYPWDLDSHLTGPLPDGSRFHMFYPYAEMNSGSPWPDFVTLDLDDVTSYGPETTTIYQQIGGVYRFLVHDYTNRYAGYSTALSDSGAQVRVYRGSNLVATFNVPPNQEGTVWAVFELSGTTITPVNTMRYESSPILVQAVGDNDTPPIDEALFDDLPEK